METIEKYQVPVKAMFSSYEFIKAKNINKGYQLTKLYTQTAKSVTPFAVAKGAPLLPAGES